MDSIDTRFSDRFGYQAPEVDIIVREDAPTAVRDGILMLGYGGNLDPSSMRDLLCQVLLTRPDLNNWSPENTRREVSQLMDAAPWFNVYDIAERIYVKIARATSQPAVKCGLKHNSTSYSARGASVGR